jgi:hypothetical protein
MSSKYKTDEDYEELAKSSIVSQYGQSSHRPHRTCPQSPRGPPRAPQALGESTPVGAPPRAASLQPEPDLPLAAHLSRAARTRGGRCSSG